MSDKRGQYDQGEGQVEQLDWSCTTYLAHLASLINTNMTYLHSTLSWAVTVFVGGLGLVVARSSFPDHVTFVSLLILILILGHFAVRTSKAYLNIVRFGTLEKHVLLRYLTEGGESWSESRSYIVQYHCDWISPLDFKSVAYKVLFELGFVYLFGIVIGLVFYTLFAVEHQMRHLLEFGLALLFLGLEIRMGLHRSAYFRSVVPDRIARMQR